MQPSPDHSSLELWVMESSTVKPFPLPAVWRSECSSNFFSFSKNNKLGGIIWCQTGYILFDDHLISFYSKITTGYRTCEHRNKPEYTEGKQMYTVTTLVYICLDQTVLRNIPVSLYIHYSPGHCGSMPGITNQSHMAVSFHHSVLLCYQWHHLLLVGVLCFRATMLFLCRALFLM